MAARLRREAAVAHRFDGGLMFMSRSVQVPTMPSSNDDSAQFLDLLSRVSSGGVTVTVGGFPLLSLDSGEKVVGVELRGVKEAGIRLSRLIRLEGREGSAIGGAESVAKKLSEMGWRLTLYDRGDRVASVGSGSSRLTGHVSINPLKLGSLLDALK
jgi:hypothetical protein